MQDNVTQADARGIFKGSNEQLCNSIDALLDLNDKGAVSHRVPGMAVTLLEAAHARLASTTAQTEAVQKLVEALEAIVGETLGGDLSRDDESQVTPRGSYSTWISWNDRWAARDALAAHRESQP